MVPLDENTGKPRLLKVAVTGPESTAKSTIAAQLAEHYGTVWVPEYAREYIAALDRPYTLDDILAIALRQAALEDELAAQAGRLLFCDTELTVARIWSEHAFNQCPEWILQELQARHYDLYLLMHIDNPWQPDPQREHPHMREHFFKLYEQALQARGVRYHTISGTCPTRLQNAIAAVEELLAAY